MYHCCPMLRRLFTSQYSTSPEGKLKEMKVNTTGMIIIIRCWVGSPCCGVIHCCRSMLSAHEDDQDRDADTRDHASGLARRGR